MSELRQDPVTGRWVIIAAERSGRPNEFTFERPVVVRDACPFCAGHEAMTPPEIFARRAAGAPADSPGWSIRVIPNRFPALQSGGRADVAHHGVFAHMPGIGVHEVIVETPEHDTSLAAMTVGEIEVVLETFQARILALAGDPQLRYVLIFKNHGGGAGASIEHSHSQLVGLPVLPGFVRDELDGGRRHHQATGRCVFCDIIAQELDEDVRVVEASADMVAVTPYASRFPFEMHLLPRRHGSRFEASPAGERTSFAAMIKSVLSRLDAVLDRPPYNLVLHSAPLHGEDAGDSYHWHLEILPKLSRTAGFEWGTGFSITTTAPEEATRRLRAAAGKAPVA